MPARPSALAITARVLLVPYVLALGLIVWLPASLAGRATGIVFRAARWFAREFDIPRSLVYTVFEFGANIVLFVPFGLLVALAWPQLKGWLIILLGYAASATIELGQTLQPSRFPTISDVIANTLGTAIGCLVVIVIRNAVKRRTAPPTPPTAFSSTFQQEVIGQETISRKVIANRRSVAEIAEAHEPSR